MDTTVVWPVIEDVRHIDTMPSQTSVDGTVGMDNTSKFGESFLANYKVGELLGTGSFATCYEVSLMSVATEEVYACRWITKTIGVPPTQRLSSKEIADFTQESLLHTSIKHKNVVKLFHWRCDNEGCYQILDVCQLGSLESLLEKYRRFSDEEARFLLKQVVEGVHCLHVVHQIVHRDLKPANIFVTTGHIVKIGDFGTAIRVSPYLIKYDVSGTLNYMSPEVVSSYASNQPQTYTFSPDIWSIGCMLYEFLVGQTPFYVDPSLPNEEKYKRIMSGVFTFPAYVDGEALLLKRSAKHFIRFLLMDCLPQIRPTISILQQHPYVKKATPPFLTRWTQNLKQTNLTCFALLRDAIKHLDVLVNKINEAEMSCARKRNAQGILLHVFSLQPEVTDFPDHVIWSMHCDEDRIFNYRMSYGTHGVYFPDQFSFIFHPNSKDIRVFTNEKEFTCKSELLPEVIADRVDVSQLEYLLFDDSPNPLVNVHAEGPHNCVVAWTPNPDMAHRSYMLDNGTLQITKSGTKAMTIVLFTSSQVYLPFWDKDENKYKAKVCYLSKMKSYDLQTQDEVMEYMETAISIQEFFRSRLQKCFEERMYEPC